MTHPPIPRRGSHTSFTAKGAGGGRNADGRPALGPRAVSGRLATARSQSHASLHSSPAAQPGRPRREASVADGDEESNWRSSEDEDDAPRDRSEEDPGADDAQEEPEGVAEPGVDAAPGPSQGGRRVPPANAPAPSAPPPGARAAHRGAPPRQSALRSSQSMFLRGALQPRAPAAPVVDTQMVTGGAMRIQSSPMRHTTPPRGRSTAGGSHGFYLEQEADEGARADGAEAHAGGSPTPERHTQERHTQEVTGTPKFARSHGDSVTSLQSLAAMSMLRSSSTQSLSDAGSFTTGSPSREQLTQLLGRVNSRGNAQQSLRTLSGEPGARTGLGGKSVAATIANMLHSGRVTERPAKPVVSKFAGYRQQFDPSASALTNAWEQELQGRIVSVDVPEASVFSGNFVARVRARMKAAAGADRRGAGTWTGCAEDQRPAPSAARSPGAPSSTHAAAREQAGMAPAATAAPAGAPPPARYRYLLDYALSGPPIEKAGLSDAELVPQLKSDVTEAVTQRDAHAKAFVPDSTTTLGPNMIPFHFIHALTSAVENALALDQAEVPAMASLLPGVPERSDSGTRDEREEAARGDGLHFIDTQSMRAIAFTAQAVSMQRIHTVTRRFADPLREALARLAGPSGLARELTQGARVPPRPATGTPRVSPNASMWNLYHSAAQGSSADRIAPEGHRVPGAGLPRSSTAAASLANLGVDAAR
ncbi:hypothetical protein MSPP1_002482 [Malassezia sp. CBS 17886]|nr:hypothetical protein MSPP1_002482 [Malassezia sp. CBS 17886]